MNLDSSNEVLTYIAISFEGIAAVSSILFYKRYKNQYLKFLPLILSFTFLTEFYSTICYKGYNNVFYYNIYNYIVFNYFYWIYTNMLYQKKVKSFLKLGAITYSIAFVLDAIMNDLMVNSLLFSYVIGGGLIILSAILYYMQKLATENDLGVKKDVLFWISTGLLLFYVGYLPIKITRIYFASNSYPYNTIWMVQLVLIIVQYFCFTLGFKWSQKK